MAMPNDILSGNGETAASIPKKKPRKSGATMRNTAKRGATPTSVETLFTQEPNPFQQPVPPYIWIDFPQQDDILRGPHYNIRLGVGGADLVEISIDKSPWLPCRLTSGYWWYDWSAIAPGKHTLTARMRTYDSRWFKTPARLCSYRPE